MHRPVFHRISLAAALTLAALSFSSPTLRAENKNNIIEDETGTYYIIQKGDTLWDLSNKFLNSPWHWPELWKENSDVPISNPHRIYPGQRIRLFRRDTAVPEPGESAPKAAAPPLPASEPSEVVPPSAAPLSSPAAADQPEIAEEDVAPDFVYTPIDQVGFIRKEATSPAGSIFKVKDDKQMISTGDTVFIRTPPDTSPDIGKYYTIYRLLDPLIDSENHTSVGIQHLLTGVVEITRKEPEFAVGQIIRSFRPIRLDDRLMPYEERSPRIRLTKAPEGISGKILLCENRSFIFGQHDIAFIDRGRVHGIEPGQRYDIYKASQPHQKSRETVQTAPPVDISIGSLLVLLTEEDTSTVLITKSDVSLHTGMLIRSQIR